MAFSTRQTKTLRVTSGSQDKIQSSNRDIDGRDISRQRILLFCNLERSRVSVSYSFFSAVFGGVVHLFNMVVIELGRSLGPKSLNLHINMDSSYCAEVFGPKSWSVS